MALARIVEYDVGWPSEFRTIAERLGAALGPAALRIDHIGSTSVPGLAAKDVIDLQVTVAALDTAQLIAAMGQVGLTASHEVVIDYDHVPPGANGTDQAEWAKL